MLKNNKIVVVGGSSGVGFAVACKAIDAGAEVVIASRSADRLESAVQQLNGRVCAELVDATNEQSIADLFHRVGTFDHLVCTLKLTIPSKSFLESETPLVGKAFDTKFWGQYRLAKHGAPCIRTYGSITFTSGIASRRAYLGYSSVSAMNAAVEALTKSAAVELAPIRVNCVCPGFVDIDPPSSARSDHVRTLVPNLPLGRLAGASEIADTYMYLFTAQYVTGTVAVVDGGAAC